MKKDELNIIEKFILPKIYGYKWNNKFTWGELYLGVSGSDCAIEFCRDSIFEIHDLFIIKVPYLFKIYIEKLKPEELINKCDFYNEQKFQYGFNIVENWRSISFGWGKKIHFWDFPWSWEWQKTEIMDYDFNIIWKDDKKLRKRNKNLKNDEVVRENTLKQMKEKEDVEKLVTRSFPYIYTLKSGNVQNRIADVYVDKMTWGMKWFPFIRKSIKCIDVQFNDEVGESSGSWKGGTIGCSYEMLKGETPEMTLRRMEKERKF